jgi:hypothetical protein
VAASLQSTARVLMIRPAAFGPNAETAATNVFQGRRAGSAAEVLAAARAEFQALVGALRAAGVEVFVVEDTPVPPKPDALFPNNWVSFHPGGRVVLYPLLAPSRRSEVRPEVLAELERRGAIGRARVLDLRAEAADGCFLEGTGSLVLDRIARVAYACLSPRTSRELLARFSRELDFEPVAFHAFDGRGTPIYHTNVMMSVGTEVAVVALESIQDRAERESVVARLAASGRELVPLTLAQVESFAGNLLELRAQSGEALFVLSARARTALRREQLAVLERHGRLVPVDVETIETCGGGSVRCMIAELF